MHLVKSMSGILMQTLWASTWAFFATYATWYFLDAEHHKSLTRAKQKCQGKSTEKILKQR